MHVVLTHSNADCDAFASQIAVSRLYPDAVVVQSRRVAPRVHRFLSLHAGAFELVGGDELDVNLVSEVTVVDVRPRRRLREHKAVLERIDAGGVFVRVFDHHGEDVDDLDADESHVEAVGATTTLLVERMRSRGMVLNVVDATLFALAIHVDTGSLTYDTTTPRDAVALEWLLAQGASLEVVERYLRLPLDEGQRRAFLLLMEASEAVEFPGASVGVGAVHLDSGVDGLAHVTTQALRLSPFGAMFAAFSLKGRKVQIVGRSRTNHLHVGRIMKALGGGGHASAGAASIKTGDPAAAVRDLVSAVQADAGDTRHVAVIAESDIPRLEAGMSIKLALTRLESAQWGAALVYENDQPMGTFDLRFARRAVAADRGELPVKSSMAHEVRSVAPDASLLDAEREMGEAVVGLVAIRRGDGPIEGVITRSALLAARYEHGW